MRICVTLMALAILLMWSARDTRAQLISPGELTAVHKDLQGIRNCTRCHVLGVAGASREKCLACHEPLSERLTAEKGYHATLDEDNCAECHKEHFGDDFQLVRFDSTRFEHAKVDFELRGRHAELGCRECHAADLITAPGVRKFKGEASALDRTYMGLGTLCVSCHEGEDPHRGQFAESSCDDCHNESDWNEADRFAHDRTRYRLTGLHREVRCRECHVPLDDSATAGALRFTGVPHTGCESCHEDVHRGAMGARCSDCHGTGGWHRLADRGSFERRFDHSTTEFPLVGAHARAECDACHGAEPPADAGLRIAFVGKAAGNVYPEPAAADCTSCHLDYHDGVFRETPGGIVCDNCHDQEDWLPTSYGIERHDRESEFQLTGAHAPVICSSCHAKVDSAGYRSLNFRFADQTCVTCHAQDDPHAGQFGARECAACHDTRAFTIASFDHSATRWPLDGAHEDVPCSSCHTRTTTKEGTLAVRYRPLETECKACHREEG
ncbi:MAG: hypothetical protein PVI01_13025 [Gemmatimonadales bacterium]|jgi:hypothetical protein